MVDDRRCPTCGKTKPATEFSNNRSKSGGKNWQCRACDKIAAAAYRLALRDRTDAPGPCSKGHPRHRTQNGTARCNRCRAQTMANWRHANKEKSADIHRRANRKWVRTNRDAALAILGGACACCGQNRRVFLHIDHINDGGNRHRRETGVRNSYGICVWIKKNPEQAPALCQILCANCNMAKALEENHTCP